VLLVSLTDRRQARDALLTLIESKSNAVAARCGGGFFWTDGRCMLIMAAGQDLEGRGSAQVVAPEVQLRRIALKSA
jgi:hypothetical protein